ncbi:MAG TPA: hypothetical protein PLC88_07880 [Syntrophomonas sp.]|nr:hypothetical protein [Syntrophomonas sp.]HRW11785.1 hypothetical protein [Syntrophomonas sp.]
MKAKPNPTIIQENTLQVMADTLTRIDSLKCFHIPIVLSVIEQYKVAGIEGYFMEQQELQLQKLLSMLVQLEEKLARLQQRLLIS